MGFDSDAKPIHLAESESNLNRSERSLMTPSVIALSSLELEPHDRYEDVNKTWYSLLIATIETKSVVDRADVRSFARFGAVA